MKSKVVIVPPSCDFVLHLTNWNIENAVLLKATCCGLKMSKIFNRQKALKMKKLYIIPSL